MNRECQRAGVRHSTNCHDEHEGYSQTAEAGSEMPGGVTQGVP